MERVMDDNKEVPLCLVELWAANMEALHGGAAGRASKTVYSGTGDLVEEVSASLGVLHLIAGALCRGEPPRSDAVAGVPYVVTLLVESAQRAMAVGEQERQRLTREVAELQDRLKREQQPGSMDGGVRLSSEPGPTGAVPSTALRVACGVEALAWVGEHFLNAVSLEERAALLQAMLRGDAADRVAERIQVNVRMEQN